MKIKLLFFAMMFSAASAFAQNYAYISGYITDITNGTPIANQSVYVYADSSYSNSTPAGFTFFNTVYTDINGFYYDSIPLSDNMGGVYSQGSLFVYTYDCNSNYSIDTVTFLTGLYNLTANFSICRSCSATVAVNADSTNIFSYDFSTAAADSIVSWTWNFGDSTATSSLANPSHTYLAAGQYNACLTYTTSFGCSNSICNVVHAGSTGCNPYFAYSATLLTVNFTDYSSTDSGIITQWLWTFGDSTTSNLQNPTHTYSADGNYTVSLTITSSSGCSNSYYSYFNVSSVAPMVDDYGCDAGFSVNTTSSNSFDFYDESFANINNTDQIVSWSWTFGDGSTSNLQSPSHIYSVPGAYQVGLTIFTAEGCSSYLDVSVDSDTILYGACQSDFELLYDQSQPFTYNILEASMTEDPNQVIVSYLWDLGDGTSTNVANPPAHTYSLPGVYQLSLTITTVTGCVSKYTENLVVDSACYMYLIASSIINETAVGTSDGAINLNVIGTAPFTFSWSNGATTQDVSGLTAGYENVWVTDAAGCQSWGTFNILTQSDSSNWVYTDTLVNIDYADTCFNFVPASAEIYGYTFPGGDTISITWIVYDSTATLHVFVTATYSFDSTSLGYYTALLSINCDSTRSIHSLTLFSDQIYIRGLTATGISSVETADKNVSVYPNPVTDMLNISFALPKSDKISIDILNAVGQVVQSENVNNDGGAKVVKINTTSLAKGIYFIKLAANEQIITRKFIK